MLARGFEVELETGAEGEVKGKAGTPVDEAGEVEVVDIVVDGVTVDDDVADVEAGAKGEGWLVCGEKCVSRATASKRNTCRPSRGAQ